MKGRLISLKGTIKVKFPRKQCRNKTIQIPLNNICSDTFNICPFTIICHDTQGKPKRISFGRRENVKSKKKTGFSPGRRIMKMKKNIKHHPVQSSFFNRYRE